MSLQDPHRRWLRLGINIFSYHYNEMMNKMTLFENLLSLTSDFSKIIVKESQILI